MEEIKEEGEPFSMSREGSESLNPLNRRDTINFANSINHTQLEDPTEILRLKEGFVKMSTLNWVS